MNTALSRNIITEITLVSRYIILIDTLADEAAVRGDLEKIRFTAVFYKNIPRRRSTMEARSCGRIFA